MRSLRSRTASRCCATARRHRGRADRDGEPQPNCVGDDRTRGARSPTSAIAKTLPARPVLEAIGIATTLGHRELSFTLHKGEILGLYGLVGAGRTELARALIGDARITAGELRLNGAPVSIGSVSQAIRQFGIGYISEDRKGEGLILAHPDPLKRRDHRLASHPVSTWLLAGGEASNEIAGPLARKLEIKNAIAGADGRQALGRQSAEGFDRQMARRRRSKILIIDEPTVGIDIKTKTAIHELIAEITRGDVSVLLISSDMPEMITLADRILVMRNFSDRWRA